jgi:hypothetical protein
VILLPFSYPFHGILNAKYLGLEGKIPKKSNISLNYRYFETNKLCPLPLT